MRLKPLVLAVAGVLVTGQALSAQAAPNPVVGGAGSDFTMHGGVKFTYDRTPYDKANRKRQGDFLFNRVQLGFDGAIHGVEVSAQYRFYQDKNVIHHAWLGYKFTGNDEARLGITKVPFGAKDLSHGDFNTPLDYLGLEDGDRQLGLTYAHSGPLDLGLAFFKSDAVGSLAGSRAAHAKSLYSSVTGWCSDPNSKKVTCNLALGQYNTVAARAGYTVDLAEGASTNVGVSALRGQLRDKLKQQGKYYAGAVYAATNYRGLNLNLQAARYAYRLKGIKGGINRVQLGGSTWAPSKAFVWTGNLAYTLPVSWGSVSEVTLFNDYSLMNRKNSTKVAGKTVKLANTWLDNIGAAVKTGGLTTTFNYLTGRNLPDASPSLVADNVLAQVPVKGKKSKKEHRVYVSFVYAF